MINRLIGMSCLSYIMTGVALVIIGALLPELLTKYSISYGDGGTLVFVQFIGVLVGVLSMPLVSRKLSRKTSVTLGLLLISPELFVTLLPPWPVVIAITGVAGYGAGLVEASIGTIILLSVKRKVAIAMSKLEVTFGIGALSMPFIASFLIIRGWWTYSFLLLGIGCLLTAALWMRLSFGELDDLLSLRERRDEVRAARPAFSKQAFPFLVLCTLFFLGYGGSEVSVVHFFPSLFMEKWGIASSLAASVVTFYWVGMVIGRIFCGILAEKFTYYRYLAFSTAGSLLVLLLLPITTEAWAGFALSFLLGLFMSGIFSIALIFVNKALPGMTEQTTSILFACSGLGGSLLPLAVGMTMDGFSVQTAFWLLFGVMSGMMLLLLMAKKRRDSLVHMHHI
ncbi:MFS transporter [Paenibacillus sp. J5C_2022]|uniref:MFS transporter n=1 Tax=Paenibacillus sp. J5C2022 TaxID=2977129 RepID=UPI0021CF52E8|nr:MFS transporter [Paenibacillus sp. J5C2022]MCU6709051.1 MFS transporter [Paenibacillus sp. J5C2022]